MATSGKGFSSSYIPTPQFPKFLPACPMVVVAATAIETAPPLEY